MLNAPSAYARRLSRIVDECLPAYPGVTLKPLLEELGCVHLERNSDNEWLVRYTPQPSTLDEDLVCETLLAAMRSHLQPLDRYFYTDGLSILGGLLRNRRWVKCLHDIDDAYCLAELMTRTSVVLRTNPEIVTPGYRASFASSMYEALQEWLPSKGPVESLHDAATMARSLFGDAWCDLVVDAEKIEPYDLPMFIRQTRPPFMPGVLRVKQEFAMPKLPNLEMGPM